MQYSVIDFLVSLQPPQSKSQKPLMCKSESAERNNPCPEIFLDISQHSIGSIHVSCHWLIHELTELPNRVTNVRLCCS